MTTPPYQSRCTRKTTRDQYVLGFDIGGSRLKTSVVDSTGRIVQSAIQDTGPRTSAEEMVASILDRAQAYLDERGPNRCQGVGVALPGFVEPAFGARGLPGKLPGLEAHPLRQGLEEALGVPVRCLNDGAAAALAEWRLGAGVGEDDVVVLTLGTGVGSGVVMNGRLLNNRYLGTGGGIGHFTIETEGRLCLCGNRGCAETLISAEAVAARLRDYLARGVSSYLADAYSEDPLSITFRSLIEGMDRDDPICLEVSSRFIRDLGATIINAIQAYNPSVVVLGGGPMEASDHFLPDVQRYVDLHRWVHPADRLVPIRRATLDPFAGAVGAGLSVMHA